MARVYKVTIRCTNLQGVLIEPGCHYQTDVADIGSEPDPDDVAQKAFEHLVGDFQQCLPTDATIHEVVVTEEVVKPAIGVVGSWPTAAQGLIVLGDNKLPTELVPLINIHTNTHSRSARGWTFMPSPGSSLELTSTGLWSTTFIAALTGYAGRLTTSFGVGDINVTTCKPVIYSRTRHVRSESPWVFPVSSATVKTTPTWLRSRGTAP